MSSLVAQMVKNLPAVQETQVRSLGLEDPLEKGKATHPSILNFIAASTFHSDFGSQENKICHCFHFFTICLPWSNGLDVMIFIFWLLSFKPAFSLSSFTLIKRLFSFSSLSANREVSSAYLRLLIFLWTILISACDSSSPAFHMITLHMVFHGGKEGDVGNVGDVGSIPGWGIPSRRGHGNPF